MRRHLPHLAERDRVHLTYLSEGDKPVVVPFKGLNCLLIDPAGRLSVSKYLHVVLKSLRADRAALLQQQLNLAEDECVPFDSGGVVCLTVPKVIPELLSLMGLG